MLHCCLLKYTKFQLISREKDVSLLIAWDLALTWYQYCSQPQMSRDKYDNTRYNNIGRFYARDVKVV